MNDIMTVLNINEETTFYTFLQKVSRDGFKRLLRVYIIHNERIIDITRDIAKLTERKLIKDCIFVRGCGFDTGYDLVYSLYQRLFDKTMSYKNHRWLN